MSGSMSRLIYVDDSGDPRFGWIVYGWVECTPAEWRLALREWLELRKRLWRDYGIPPGQELHTTHYAQGRGKISKQFPEKYVHDGEKYWKDFGRDVAAECLQVLESCSSIRIGAVARKTTATGSEYEEQKAEVYMKLINRWNDEHALDDSFVFVSMDGDGSAQTYFKAHRALPLDTRHVIEDPMFHDSKRSQWTQMADLVAYSAYMHVDRHARNKFAWDWYRDYLSDTPPEMI